jgi:hypothetical protein
MLDVGGNNGARDALCPGKAYSPGGVGMCGLTDTVWTRSVRASSPPTNRTVVRRGSSADKTARTCMPV